MRLVEALPVRVLQADDHNSNSKKVRNHYDGRQTSLKILIHYQAPPHPIWAEMFEPEIPSTPLVYSPNLQLTALKLEYFAWFVSVDWGSETPLLMNPTTPVHEFPKT